MTRSASPPLTHGMSGDPFVIEDVPNAERYKHRKRIRLPAHDETWEVESCGRLFALAASGGYVYDKPAAKRTNIITFSAASRLRFLKTIARIDWNSIPDSVFVTLTYPDHRVNRSNKQRTSDRSQFVRAVETFAGRKVPMIWRIEWKKRLSGWLKGRFAPHYHLLILGGPFLRKWKIRQWWQTILSHKDYVDVDVDAMGSGEMASMYVAKYCAKVSSLSSLGNVSYLNIQGRHWGITRRHLVPRFCPRRLFHLDPSQVAVLRSVGAAILPYYDIRYDKGFCLLGKHAEKFAEIWWANGLDNGTLLGYFGHVEGGEGPAHATSGNA